MIISKVIYYFHLDIAGFVKQFVLRWFSIIFFIYSGEHYNQCITPYVHIKKKKKCLFCVYELLYIYTYITQ